MNLKRVGLGLVMAMFCLCLSGSAEMPRHFYFEDYCNTTNDTIELQLQLYSAATNGVCLYEDSNTVEVVDGFYATLIGDNTVFGSLTNALAGGETFVQVIIDGVPLSPREPLVPVPYALNAASISSNAITSAMMANGAVTTNKLAGDVDARYVNVSGDVMGGDLDMDGGSLHNVAGIDWYGDGIDIEGHASVSSNVWGNWNADRLDGQHAGYFATTQQLAQKLSVTGGWAASSFNVILADRTQLILGEDGDIDLVGGEESVYDDNMHIRMRWDLGVDEPAEPSIELKPYSGAALRGLKESDRWWTDGRFSATNSGKTSEFFAVKSGRFIGDGSSLTSLPVTGLTTNESDARYVNASGDTMPGNLSVASLSLGEQARTNWYRSFVENGEFNPAPQALGSNSIAFGQDNLASGHYSFVGSGRSNIADGAFSLVAGGYRNYASGNRAIVVGGGGNMAFEGSFVGGGRNNTATGGAVVVGGSANITRGGYSFIGGGSGNIADRSSVIGGGEYNWATGIASVVAGGFGNRASAKGATVAGGYYNYAIGEYSFAGGLRAQANHHGSFVWSDSLHTNTTFTSITSNEFAISAANGVRIVGSGLSTDGRILATNSGKTSEFFAVESGQFVGDGSGLTNLPVTGLTTNDADARYINAAGDTMTGVLDLGFNNITNVVGIYGPLTGPSSNLTIMAGCGTNSGGRGGTLYLSGGTNSGAYLYGNVEVKSTLVASEIRGADTGYQGSNLFIRAGAGNYGGNTGGILRLSGGIGNSGATPGWIRLDSRVDANGQTISNALFVGNGSGLTNLPVTGLTTNEADTRYVNASGDAMTGTLNMGGNQLQNVSMISRTNYSLSIRWGDSSYHQGLSFSDEGVELDGVLWGDGGFRLDGYAGDLDLGGELSVDGQTIVGSLSSTGVVSAMEIIADETTLNGDSILFGASTIMELDAKTLVGEWSVAGSTNATNFTVAGWAKIDYIPPQGGISMGVYTNR